MYANFFLVFVFGLCSIGYGADLRQEIPPIRDLQDVPLALISMGSGEKKEDSEDSVSSLQQENDTPSNEKERYALLKSKIEDKSINDDNLLDLLYLYWCRKVNFDTLHSRGQPTLASLLVKVTRPYDDGYDIDKKQFKGRFRDLGNMIRQVDDEESPVPDNLLFAGSALEKRFEGTSYYLRTGESIGTCCNIL
ncbi:hypothetical protein [Candidatus Finniella inopinata]|uniref:Uncharacterized protein n=1 Tax=Candidatus Finniella inopinata TaxID=1696036 RepID=A0A4Q7DH39_9PROT|nr:hypothetical protein [Candidatus Finniella inopinata]RZI46093.1 hypothetical protein EQU50_03945 [Candidatus Finniella inopinata]